MQFSIKNFKSIFLCSFIALGLLFTNVTTAKADVHAGMTVAVGVNNYQANQTCVYPNKIRVNEKFSAFVLFVDEGHDIGVSWLTDGANGFQNHDSDGWGSSKMVSFPEVSFSTPGRHVIYAFIACKQTGLTHSVSYYVDVI